MTSTLGIIASLGMPRDGNELTGPPASSWLKTMAQPKAAKPNTVQALSPPHRRNGTPAPQPNGPG